VFFLISSHLLAGNPSAAVEVLYLGFPLWVGYIFSVGLSQYFDEAKDKEIQEAIKKCVEKWMFSVYMRQSTRFSSNSYEGSDSNLIHLNLIHLKRSIVSCNFHILIN